MAAKTWYMTNTAVDGYVELNESAPATALSSPVTGWIVAKTAAGNYSELLVNTERAASTFGTTVLPPATFTSGRGMRTATTYNGDFASANWTFTFEITATTSASGQDGNFGLRLWRSVNADGSSATEITSARQETGTFTNLTTGATTEIALTLNPGAFTLTDEYLFVQLAHEITGASGNNNADVNLRIGANETRIVSADFTPAANHYTLTGATGALTLSGGAGTLRSAKKLSGAVGALTLAGGAAVLRAARRLAGATGALALTGTDAVLDYSGASDPVLVGDTGALVLTGGTATLRAARRLAGATGVLTLVGGAATLTYSGGAGGGGQYGHGPDMAGQEWPAGPQYGSAPVTSGLPNYERWPEE